MDIQALNDCEGSSIAVVDEVKILVKAEVDAAIKALDKAEKKSDSLWDSFKNLQTVMQGPVAAAKDVYSAFSKLVAVGTDLYNEFASAELAAIKLNAAIANSTNMSAGAGDRLSQFADSLQSISVFEGDATKAIIGNLAAMGRSESQIKDLVTAASNLASATGQDLESAVAQLNGTLNGNVGLLGRQNGAIKNLTEEQLKNGDAIKVINEQYKGFNEKIALSASGSVEKLNLNFGSLKETIGELVAVSFQPMVNSLSDAVKKTNSLIGNFAVQTKYLSGQKLDYAELVQLQESLKDETALYLSLGWQDVGRLKQSKKTIDGLVESYKIQGDSATRRAQAEEKIAKEVKTTASISTDKLKTDKEAEIIAKKLADNEQKLKEESADRLSHEQYWERQRNDLISKRQKMQMDEGADIPELPVAEITVIDERIQSVVDEVDQINNAWSDWNFQIGDTTIEADKLADALSQVWDSATNTAGAYFDLLNNENAIEMQENKEKNDAYIKMLEDEADKYEDGSDQKKDADKEISLEKERIAKEEKDIKNKYGKQAFENEKMLALAEIAINGAVAVMKASTLGAAAPFAMAAIGALTITQAGLVAAQNYVPMAQGGIVTAPTRTLLGENGPEAIIPLRGDNKNIAMGGGGVTIIQNIGGSVVTEKYLTGQAMKAVALANRGY